MKLKEKLAEEYCIDREGGHPYVEHFRDGLQEGFVAGFEKAREMVIEEFSSYGLVEVDDEEIRNMGEEEV